MCTKLAWENGFDLRGGYLVASAPSLVFRICKQASLGRSVYFQCNDSIVEESFHLISSHLISLSGLRRPIQIHGPSKVKKKDGFVLSPVRICRPVVRITISHVVSIHVFPFGIGFGVVVVVVVTLAAWVAAKVLVMLPVVTPVVVIGRRRVVFQQKGSSPPGIVIVVGGGIVKVVVIDTAHHGGRVGDPLDGIRHVRLVGRVAIVVVFLFRRGIGGVKGIHLLAMSGDPSVHFPRSGIVHALEVRGVLRAFV